MKLLYFSDLKHLAKYGRRISNDTIIAMEYGPVMSELYDILKIADNEYFKVFQNEVHAKQSVDLDEFSDSEIECLEEAYEENKNSSFNQLTHKSHDGAWQEAWALATPHPIELAMLAKEVAKNDETAQAYILTLGENLTFFKKNYPPEKNINRVPAID